MHLEERKGDSRMYQQVTPVQKCLSKLTFVGRRDLGEIPAGIEPSTQVRLQTAAGVSPHYHRHFAGYRSQREQYPSTGRSHIFHCELKIIFDSCNDIFKSIIMHLIVIKFELFLQ